MPIRRTYAEHGDACATAHGIELIGDVWTYPIVREMLLGPKRFGELGALLHGITPAVLTARLRELQTKGLVEQVTFPPPALGKGYALTPWGHRLEDVMEGVARWAHGSPTWRPDGGLTPDAAILAMKTMSRELDAPTVPLEVQLELSDARCVRPETYRYAVTWDDRGLTATRGEHPGPAAVVTADSSRWARVLFAGDELEAHGVTGSRAVVEEMAGRFGPPA